MINDFNIYCHHMTINMGKKINPKFSDLVGKKIQIRIDRYGNLNDLNELFAFFGEPAGLTLSNPHITALIRKDSKFKPKDSNNIKNKYWTKPFYVYGYVTENTEDKGYCSILLDQDSHFKLLKIITEILHKYHSRR